MIKNNPASYSHISDELIENMISGYSLNEIICDRSGKPIDYRVLLVNSVFEKLIGLDRKDIIGKRIKEILPETESSWIERYADVAFTQKPIRFETFHTQLNKHLEIHAYSPTRGQFATIYHDISDRKQTEEQLLLFKRIFESSQEAIEISDPDGLIVYVNPAHERLFDRPIALAKKLNFRDYYPADSLEVINGLVIPTLLRGESWEGEIDVIDNSSRRFPLWKRAGVLLDEQGKIRYLYGFMHEISDHKQAEKERLISEARLKHAQRMAKLGSFHINFAKNEFWWSDQVYNTLGISRLDHSPTLSDIGRFILPDDKPTVLRLQHWLTHASIGESKDFEIRVKRSDGSVRHLDCIVSVTEASINGAIEVSGTIQDITEKKHTDEQQEKLKLQLRQTQKLESLGVLAGGIAHDFNNLLMIILGNTDLAFYRLPEDSEARQSLLEIEKAGHRAAELCKQMLAYSGRGKFVVEPVDLSEVISSITNLLEVSVSKKCTLSYNLSKNLPKIDADSSQLKQLIVNLVTNGSDALNDQSGIVTITTSAHHCDKDYLSGCYLHEDLPDGTYVTLEVSDTGCGMTQSTISKIFDPFFSTKFTGRGLGLAAVLGIVRGHNGAIRIYSEVNRGSSFKVLLPVSTAQLIESSFETTTKTNWRGEGTVLLVDDEESVLLVAQRMLELMGFSVIVAHNGREAIKLYTQHRENIVCAIVDLMMPEMDGEEAFREMRSITPHLKIILSSGYNEQDVTQRFVGKGLAGFIQKPYRLGALRDVLEKLLSE